VLGMYGAAAAERGIFAGMASINGLLSAPLVHRDVISALSAERESVDLLRSSVAPKLAAFIDIPPLRYDDFAAKVRAMESERLYGAFDGYPLDLETTGVVLRDLAPHPGWMDSAQQHGAFFRQLLDRDVRDLDVGTDVEQLIVHGRHNLLHSCGHAHVVARDLQSRGQKVRICNVDGRHNDFMQFEAPVFQQQVAPLLVEMVLS